MGGREEERVDGWKEGRMNWGRKDGWKEGSDKGRKEARKVYEVVKGCFFGWMEGRMGGRKEGGMCGRRTEERLD